MSTLFDLEQFTCVEPTTSDRPAARTTGKPAVQAAAYQMPLIEEPRRQTYTWIDWDNDPRTQEIRAKRRAIAESLGGLWKLKFADGKSLIRPGDEVFTQEGTRLMVCRIRDVFPQWGNASLDCIRVAGDAFLPSSELYHSPEKFLKKCKLITYQTFEVCYDMPREIDRIARSKKAPRLELMHTKTLERLLWEWLLRGENLANPFTRSTLAGDLQDRDRLVLGNVYNAAQKKLREVAKAMEQQIEESDFDRLFWRLLEEIATYGPGETLPETGPDWNRRRSDQAI